MAVHYLKRGIIGTRPTNQPQNILSLKHVTKPRQKIKFSLTVFLTVKKWLSFQPVRRFISYGVPLPASHRLLYFNTVIIPPASVSGNARHPLKEGIEYFLDIRENPLHKYQT